MPGAAKTLVIHHIMSTNHEKDQIRIFLQSGSDAYQSVSTRVVEDRQAGRIFLFSSSQFSIIMTIPTPTTENASFVVLWCPAGSPLPLRSLPYSKMTTAIIEYKHLHLHQHMYMHVIGAREGIGIGTATWTLG